MAAAEMPSGRLTLPDELWVELIYSFALSYHHRVIDREHLMKSLTPLYLGWVASFATQTENETAAQVEDRIEKLCLVYEQLKSYVMNRWTFGTQKAR